MKCYDTALPGVKVIEPKLFEDSRGFFMETWNASRYAELGITANFVQDNLSLSTKGILRGLHFQQPNPQGKLVYVLQGEVFDVVVDIRYGSPTFGHWVGIILSAQNKRQLYIPEGFAHGFCVVSDTALFAYKCTDFYLPQNEGGICWDDSDLGITWPVVEPTLSEKDKQYPKLKEIPLERLVKFGLD
ncbi:dTDP-4-dehydrorhamnose 3,5-epimerase [Sporomusa sp.]|uniref:dTDP-4-dehydrorhamnose 3,5-epimerase n=1 Tax=Sporomusa sp. TaxID=2078658 RepID=UPI002C906407|nr:dTDP-4-dehydrorhamnose 3,5-epimerase [Sporomusa sp.]HWR41617.1 dTDP-4-dehydrorhamnose 3,5-epimerase [Sporomusa sp.]